MALRTGSVLRIGATTDRRNSGRWVVTDPHWVRRNHLATIATNHAEPARAGTAVHTADPRRCRHEPDGPAHATQVRDARLFGLNAHVCGQRCVGTSRRGEPGGADRWE